ncbi:MAG: hypothetical protein COA33_000870 [Fluviicola sp.]|nr:hypothetical protein [Fluviicola sp.]
MKKGFYILIFLLFLFSCVEENKKNVEELTNNNTLSFRQVKLLRNDISNNVFLNWSSYYKSLDSSFSADNFFLEDMKSINFIPGNINGIFDDEFDEIYTDFIVFSPSKVQYIDLDSYQWTIDENDSPIFSADQEINLVNISEQTVERIDFKGPHQWVEDAYWIDDSTIVLLENSSEGILRVSKINLFRKEIKTFKCGHTIHAKSKYSELRLIKKGLNPPVYLKNSN